MINHKIVSFSAVQIYDLSYIPSIFQKSDPIDRIRILGIIGTGTGLRLSLMRVIFSNANDVYLVYSFQVSVYESLQEKSLAHKTFKCLRPLKRLLAYRNEFK